MILKLRPGGYSEGEGGQGGGGGREYVFGDGGFELDAIGSDVRGGGSTGGGCEGGGLDWGTERTRGGEVGGGGGEGDRARS
jgi:hypothetical protein